MITRKKIREFLYDQDLMKKMEPFVDSFLLYGIAISLIGFIYVSFFAHVHFTTYIVSDFLIAVVLSITYVFRKHLYTEMKLTVILLIVFSYGIYLFEKDGIFGTGIYLMISGIILSVVFFKHNVAFVMTVCVSLLGLEHLLRVIKRTNMGYVTTFSGDVLNTYYVFIYIGVIIAAVSAFISIRALKNFLLKNINTINRQMKQLEKHNKSLRTMNKEIEYLAFHNLMTTLPNKSKFRNDVQDYFSSNEKGTLFMIDVKSFQKFNAFYGIDKGNDFLNSIGTYIRESFDESFHKCYMGNNTFAFWIPYETTADRIMKYYDRFISDFQSKSIFDFDLDFHMVAAVRMNTMSSYDDLYTIADKALSLAKRDKKDSLVFIDREYLKKIEAYESMVEYIDKSIHEEDFLIYYQEKVDTITGDVVGLEALSRLERFGEIIGPNEFIPIIEENELAPRFGQMVLKKVLDDLPSIKGLYGEVCVSLNVSPNQIIDPDFIKLTTQNLESHNSNACCLELEITENILLQDFERSFIILNKVRDIGFKVSIDDFGTGFSSMSYITHLPVDVIKIDKSFIDDLVTCKKTKSVVKAIIDIAHTNDMMVVAEGVESIEQVQALNEMDCKIVQGFLYSCPKPLNELGLHPQLELH